MSKPIFTALSPNTERDDVWLAIKTIIKPWNWKDGNASNVLKGQFAQWLGIKNLVFFESGRTALFALLKALNLNNTDEVLLQSYTCIAVPEPVLWIGARPIYVDTDKESFTMNCDDLKKKITKNSKVLIIQHTFGHAANLDALLKIAKENNLFVIEDCAHALGSTYAGKKLGTFGDASFFSFGRDKVISSVFGSVIAIKDDEVAKKVKTFWESCPLPSAGWIFQQLIHPVLMSFIKFTYPIGLGKILQYLFLRLGVLSKAVYKEERLGLRPPFIFKKFPNALAELALNQFNKLDKFNQHRRGLAAIYKQGLPEIASQSELNHSHSIYLRYTIRMLHAHKLLRVAAKSNIYLGDWYTTGLAPVGADYIKMKYDPTSCPNAEKLATETLNLPTNIQTSQADAEKIISFVKNYVISNQNN